jgi:hypothetical protein
VGDFGGNQLSPGSIGLSPLARGQGSGLHPAPLRASTALTGGFALPRARSPGFGSHGRASGPYGTRPLTGRSSRLRALRFPYAFGAEPLRLGTPVNSPPRFSKRAVRPRSSPLVLPGFPGFLRGESLLSGRTRLSPPGFRIFSLPFSGFFSAFPHGTAFAIGLGTYLALAAGVRQIPAGKPADGTQDGSNSLHGYAYGAITLYGGAFQPTSASRAGREADPSYHPTSSLG